MKCLRLGDDVETEELHYNGCGIQHAAIFEELFKNEETKAVLDKYLAGIEDHPMFGMIQTMTVDTMSELASEQFNEKMLYTLNKELTKIKK